MIKKYITIFLVFFMLLSTSAISLAATPLKIVSFDYFGTMSCLECSQTLKYLDSVIDTYKKQGITIKYNFYDISQKNNSEKLLDYDSVYKVSTALKGVGNIVFIGNYYYYGKSIPKSITKTIDGFIANPDTFRFPSVKSSNNYLSTMTTIFNKFIPIGVLVAGFIDGFNPCAIAMLLFFISFMLANNRKSTEVIFTGVTYILGTFVSYFLIGTSLLRIAFIFKNAKYLLIGIFITTIVFSVVLSILHFTDFLKLRKGNLKDIKTQLPMGIRHKINNFIRKRNFSRYIYLTAFVSGFIVSILEFFCTGQIYLPTISYVLASGIAIVPALGYLFLYNLAFVTPLIAICIFIAKGKEVMEMSQILLNKMYLIKLVGCIFFIIIAVIMSIELMKII